MYQYFIPIPLSTPLATLLGLWSVLTGIPEQLSARAPTHTHESLADPETQRGSV